jgi:hypothetical protein
MSGVLAGLIGSFAPVATSYESIATVTGNGSATSFTFNSISGTYKSLQIRGVALVESGTSSSTLQMRVNGVTSGYASHTLNGNGTTASASSVTNSGTIDIPYSAGQYNRTYGQAIIVDIIDYASTSKNKTIRYISGLDTNGTDVNSIAIGSALYNSTSAITSITIFNNNGTAFKNGQTFALYGIKG